MQVFSIIFQTTICILCFKSLCKVHTIHLAILFQHHSQRPQLSMQILYNSGTKTFLKTVIDQRKIKLQELCGEGKICITIIVFKLMHQDIWLVHRPQSAGSFCCGRYSISLVEQWMCSKIFFHISDHQLIS